MHLLIVASSRCYTQLNVHLSLLPSSFPIPQSSGCVSGCSEGHVVHWDMNSGNCVHDLGEYGALVMKLECAGGSTVGLFAENTMVVWENSTGEILYTLH